MSGGHFNYKQYEIEHIADQVEQMIIDNESEELDEWGNTKGYHFTEDTMAEFKKALVIIRQAQVYAQRIDWLVSGDDGEDNFHRRLKHDLETL
jgi:hypothetical protein